MYFKKSLELSSHFLSSMHSLVCNVTFFYVYEWSTLTLIILSQVLQVKHQLHSQLHVQTDYGKKIYFKLKYEPLKWGTDIQHHSRETVAVMTN